MQAMMIFRRLLLCFIIALPCRSYADELKIYNKSSDSIEFGIRPSNGGWDSKDSYSEEELRFLAAKADEERYFTIKSGQSVSVKCGWCSQFKVEKIYSWWMGAPEKWDIGSSYVITGKEPVYQVIKDEGAPILAVIPSGLHQAHIDLSAKSPSDVLQVTLSKEAGYWLWLPGGMAAMTSPTTDVTLEGNKVVTVTCGDCRGVAIKSINGKVVNHPLNGIGGYLISSNGDVVDTAPRPPPMPAAPPSAAKEFYLVNGWTKSVRFLLYESSSDNVASRMVTLDARKGEQFHCKDTCIAVIRTGQNSLRRLLSPGGSYIIGLDQESNLLDITSYGDH